MPEHARVDQLDADAVCAQCGTVNPEETLICRVCGNNLRDQRAMRMVAEQMLEKEGESLERRQFLLGALTLLGILLVLWTALNVDTLTNWLINAQRVTNAAAISYWEGADSTVFDALLADLTSVSPTDEEMEQAQEQPLASDRYDGRYVLVMDRGMRGPRVTGTASIQMRGSEAYFVARLDAGAEVRGRARLQGDNALAAGWDEAAARYAGDFFAVSGVALKKADGSYECFGQSETADDRGFEFMAYRLPEP